MTRTKRPPALLLACLLVTLSAVSPSKNAAAGTPAALHIDVPVKLEQANVVFDMGHLVMSTGDMPFLLGDLNLLAGDYKQWGTKGNIVAVSHGDAAYLVLNDTAYNFDRHVLNDESYNTGRHVKSGYST